MITWLTDDLRKKIKHVFEPEYARELTDGEVITIATNLTDFMEGYLKFKLRQTHENQQNRP